MRRRETMVLGIVSVVLSGVLLVAFVRYVERNGIFFPERDLKYNPGLERLAYKDVYFMTDDGVRLHGWMVHRPAAAHTVLFLHGNAGNMGDRIDKIAGLYKLGCSVFIIDYRGYGYSGGRPTEQGIYRDARAALAWLAREDKTPADNVVLYGESIGTAAAVDLASSANVKGVILEGAISTARDLARVHYPFVPGFLVSVKFDSISKIGRVTAPKLFLCSKTDEIVPYQLTRGLYDAAPQPKRLVELIGGHNTMCFDSAREYTAALSEFLETLPAGVMDTRNYF